MHSLTIEFHSNCFTKGELINVDPCKTSEIFVERELDCEFLVEVDCEMRIR